MTEQEISLSQLFDAQVNALKEEHFLLLYWATIAEGNQQRYNMTNCFDDLKSAGLTRTKQTAMAMATALEVLRFIDIRDEGNRKNIYITNYGAVALKTMVVKGIYKARNSTFLQGQH